MHVQDNNITTKLTSYSFHPTEDGSMSFNSKLFDEDGHSTSGARDETFHNYIQGCEIIERVNQGLPIRILEVGFGMGVGLKTLSEELEKIDIKSKVEFHSFELDEEFAKWSLKQLGLSYTQKIVDETVVLSGQFLEKHPFKIYCGDATDTVKLLTKDYYTAIFQDPFSPKKNPDLWSLKWFSKLKEVSSQNVILSTYSSSISIRAELYSSGWSVHNRKGFGRKRTCSYATLNGITDSNLVKQIEKYKQSRI